jgi:hypothetical protein
LPPLRLGQTELIITSKFTCSMHFFGSIVMACHSYHRAVDSYDKRLI